MTKATLKINSYTNSSTVLKNDNIIFNANKTNNFKKDKPIIEYADAIISAINDELNSEYELVVYGNMFEQAFMSLKSSGAILCTNYKSHSPNIALSTIKRLSMLSELYPKQSGQISISIECNETEVSLPEYPLVTVRPGGEEHTIYVSSDSRYLESALRNSSSTEECGFLIDGDSKNVNGKYIIGCTTENINDMVSSYIETKYINPLIGQMFDNIQKSLPTKSIPK